MKKIGMVGAAKKSAKRTRKAIIVAMAAIAGTNYAQMDAAARAAMADMKADMGTDAYGISYTWNPFDGMLA